MYATQKTQKSFEISVSSLLGLGASKARSVTYMSIVSYIYLCFAFLSLQLLESRRDRHVMYQHGADAV